MNTVVERAIPTPDEQAEAAAGQLTEAQEIAQGIGATSPSEGETLFAALSRGQKTAVLIAAGELGLSARAFSKGQQNLWPLLNRGNFDPEDKVPALSDADWFKVYRNRNLRLRLPFPNEIDWSTAAIDAPVAILVVSVKRDAAGNFHRYPLMAAMENAGLIEKPGGASEEDLKRAILNSMPLQVFGVRVRNADEVRP